MRIKYTLQQLHTPKANVEAISKNDNMNIDLFNYRLTEILLGCGIRICDQVPTNTIIIIEKDQNYGNV